MKTTTSIKIDKEVKEEASKLASELGLSLSSIINASLKNFVRERRISFNVQPKLNKKTETALLKMKEDIKKGKNLKGPFESAEDLFKALEI